MIETFGRQRYSRVNLQIPGLVQKGFRVIAPDLRGAINGESDAPQDVQAYNLQKALVKDVAGTTLCPHAEQNCRGLNGFSVLLVVHLMNSFVHPVYDQLKHT